MCAGTTDGYKYEGVCQVINAYLMLKVFFSKHSLSQGDSGGPLAAKNSQGQWTVIGVVSWRLAGGGGCDSHTYSVFTRSVLSGLDMIHRFIVCQDIGYWE